MSATNAWMVGQSGSVYMCMRGRMRWVRKGSSQSRGLSYGSFSRIWNPLINRIRGKLGLHFHSPFLCPKCPNEKSLRWQTLYFAWTYVKPDLIYPECLGVHPSPFGLWLFPRWLQVYGVLIRSQLNSAFLMKFLYWCLVPWKWEVHLRLFLEVFSSPPNHHCSLGDVLTLSLARISGITKRNEAFLAYSSLHKEVTALTLVAFPGQQQICVLWILICHLFSWPNWPPSAPAPTSSVRRACLFPVICSQNFALSFRFTSEWPWGSSLLPKAEEHLQELS